MTGFKICGQPRGGRWLRPLLVYKCEYLNRKIFNYDECVETLDPQSVTPLSKGKSVNTLQSVIPTLKYILNLVNTVYLYLSVVNAIRG